MYVFINNTQLYVYKYKHYIYLHTHITIYISIKVNIIHIFSYEYSLTHHIFRRRFIYIHTFFHYKMMCGCRLAVYLCDISRADYGCRLHHSRVAPSEPIWATFAPILGNIYPQLIRAATSQQSCHSRLRRATIIYMHIFAGENDDAVTCTRTHEKNSARFFSRRAIICTVYCWEKCKKM